MTAKRPPPATDLQTRRQAAMAQGGPEKIARHHQRGKLTARERVESITRPRQLSGNRLIGQPSGAKAR